MQENTSHPRRYLNLSVDELIIMALERGEGTLTDKGALSVFTVKKTDEGIIEGYSGRSPKDKFTVQEKQTSDNIAWGKLNQPISEERFQMLWKRAEDYLATIDAFEGNLQVGADETHYLPVKAITEYAWHQLFVHQLFIRPADFHGSIKKPEWTLLSLPGLKTDPSRDGVNSSATLIIHLSARKVLLCGHKYAGEMKKALFSVLNYWLPESDVLPMHCSANVGTDGDVALFFGLSGTGKTTLSADESRALIGDDEHGWSDTGIFNFEGGCYAKCIDLSKEREPVIWNAIQKGAVMENVVVDPKTRIPNYADSSLTQNTRAAYPRDLIEKRIIENRVNRHPKSVIFLTCDLYGVLPPVAYLNYEQAIYYFLSGYTALVGSTEVGQKEAIKTTFSTCFGAPFFPRPPQVYAKLLEKRLLESQARVYLVNTGWYGGSYGTGQRFPIPITRRIVNAVLNGDLKTVEYSELPHFKFKVPKQLLGVESEWLDPRLTWKNESLYNASAQALIEKFVENFKQFELDERIQQAGPVYHSNES